MSEFEGDKQLAWESYWEGYKLGYGVENYDDMARRTAKREFERWYDREQP